MVQGLISVRGKRFYPSSKCPACSGAHPASCLMGAESFFLEIKHSGHEVDHLPPAGGEVQNKWN
jgi:hypothetical protein